MWPINQTLNPLSTLNYFRYFVTTLYSVTTARYGMPLSVLKWPGLGLYCTHCMVFLFLSFHKQTYSVKIESVLSNLNVYIVTTVVNERVGSSVSEVSGLKLKLN